MSPSSSKRRKVGQVRIQAMRVVERRAELRAHALHGVALVAADEAVLVVADDGERAVLARHVDHALGVGPAVDEIAHEDELMARRIEARGAEELEELGVAALNITDDEQLPVHGRDHCNRSDRASIQ